MGVSARYREILFTLTKSVQKNPHKFSRLHPNPWNGTEVAFCLGRKLDGFVKSRKMSSPVIPAKAGIQEQQALLDPGFRRGDGFDDFL
jgi:hypothetical protein